MGMNPMQSNASMTYDSFWSTHTTAGSWRKVAGQGSNGNLGGLSDATAGGFDLGMGMGSGPQDGASGSDGMDQSTGVPMSATDGLHE